MSALNEDLVGEVAQAIRDSNGSPGALEWWSKHPQLVPAHVYARAALGVLTEPSTGNRHLPIFTRYSDPQRRPWHGVHCSCGWVFGMGNELSAHTAFDKHVLNHAGIETPVYGFGGSA